MTQEMNNPNEVDVCCPRCDTNLALTHDDIPIYCDFEDMVIYGEPMTITCCVCGHGFDVSIGKVIWNVEE